ncbi:MAG: hypothetical protein EXR69_04330 [Myxococcales bacterium]|nr:hypothetical protein [Myxococcales bacterium]
MSDGLARALDAEIVVQGVICVEHEGRRAEVEVVEADRLAVRVMRVRVVAGGGASPAGGAGPAGGRSESLHETATRLAEAFRGLPERMIPIEVSPTLGGAVLRSAPEDVRDREYFEARTDGRVTDLERIHAPAGEERRAVPFTLTRETLRRIVERVGSG